MATKSRSKKYLIWKSNQSLCFRALPGIIGVGGVYPLVLVFATSIIFVLKNGMPAIWGLIGSIFLGCLLGYFLGVHVAMLLGALFMYLLNSLNSLMGNLFAVRWIVGASGSLAVYVIPASIMIANEEAGTLIYFFLGPAMGMLFGFLGAVSYLDSHYADQVSRQTANTQPKLQFKISHILIATAISASVVGIAQFSENMMIAYLSGFWVIMQPLIVITYLGMARFFRPLLGVFSSIVPN